MPIKIPQDGQISIPNNSDKFGNILYTKSLTLDEDGYIKLSPRAVALISDADDSDFGLPLALGRKAGNNFYAVTSDKAYIFDLLASAASGMSAAADVGTDVPGTADFSLDSHGKWWQNRWYTTINGGLFYKDPSTGTWHDASVSLTTGKAHYLEVHKTLNRLCITNGNQVLAIDTSHVTQATLTLSSGYEAVGLAYNNDRMAVSTRLSDTAAGQYEEAVLSIWNGSSSNPSASFPVGSDAIQTVVPFRSSFGVLTRLGQWLEFNGGGFENPINLPFFFRSLTWGDAQNPEMFGTTFVVDGNRGVYLNINTAYEPFGQRSESYLWNAPGGIVYLDRNKGLYHRYAPSISKVSRLTVTNSNVNTTTNVMTVTAGTIPDTGNPIKYIHNPTTQIGGLYVGRIYYCIKLSSSTFSLAATKEDALTGTAVDLTSVGDSNNYFLALNVLDYGASRLNRTGGIAITEATSQSFERLVFGAELYRHDATSFRNFANFTVSGFRNIGYLVTPKAFSPEVTDSQQKVFVKYRPLATEDKIIVKAKPKELKGLPLTTDQSGVSMEWTSDNEFKTTADLSDAKTYLDLGNGRELECEIVSGAGAGQMSQIESIAFGSGVYSVTLKDNLDGALPGRFAHSVIDCWKYCGTATVSDSLGFKEFPVGAIGKDVKVKVILDGVEIGIEEVGVVNNTHQRMQ